MDANPQDGGQPRSACTECQRRKQKCNRQWPCNHCQKRKVADRCRFFHATTQTSDRAPPATGRKRNRAGEELAESSSDEDDTEDFEALGYGGAHFFTNLDVRSEKKSKPVAKQYCVTASECHQLQRAIQVMPPRTTTDALVQNFLTRVNYHYYIVYPPAFLHDYREWWISRFASKPLSLSWTCLLLMVCACSSQYADADLKRKLEMELGDHTHRLSNQYHNAARELYSAIPISSNHILNVQHLLHSSYWYKSEARFVESWHVLSTAIREAQALGMHQDELAGSISEFDAEMRRRLWCVLDAWDWQISALLSRPKLIDRTECMVSLPTLTLESFCPSPLLHMKLQSEVIGLISSHSASSREAGTPGYIDKYMRIITSWMQRFPPVYDLGHPDTSTDSIQPWVTLHRHYLHTMGYSMLLDPLRAYMATRMTMYSPRDDLRIRNEAVGYTLKLMDKLSEFFEFLYPKDARFHWALFSIFDTAAVLCSAILHDEDRCISRREEIFLAVDAARSMLQRLAAETRTAKVSYDILSKLAKRIDNPYLPPNMAGNEPRRARLAEDSDSLTPPFMMQPGEISLSSSEVGSSDDFHASPASPVGSGGMAPSRASASPAYGSGYADVSRSYQVPGTTAPVADAYDVNYTMPPYSHAMTDSILMPAPPHNPYMPPTPRESYAQLSLDGFSEEQLGDLAALWNYQSLDLNFVPSQSV